jgi:hypothetical protein
MLQAWKTAENNSVTNLKRYPLLIIYVKPVLCFVAASIVLVDSTGFVERRYTLMLIDSTGFVE